MSAPEGVTFHKGRFVVQLSLGNDPATGKRIRRQFTAPACEKHEDTVETCRGCQNEARDLRAEKLAELATNTYVASSEMTLGEWLDIFLEAHDARVRTSTLRNYKVKVESTIKPRIGHVRLQQIDTAMLEAFYARCLAGDELRPQGYAHASVRQCHAVIRRALRDAVKPRGQHLLYNPAAEVEFPSEGDGDDADDVANVLQVWTAEQLRTFLAAATEHPDYAFFYLAAVTGMRRSELAGLKWDMVDLDRGQVRVERTRHVIDSEEVWSRPKSKRSRRTISISDVQCSVMREHRKAQAEQRLAAGPAWEDNGLVFCAEDGTGYRLDHYSKAFKDLVEALEIPTIRLHDLRHTHATLLIEAGRPIKEVSERLGHSSAAFTMDVYGHVTDAMRATTSDVLDKMLGG